MTTQLNQTFAKFLKSISIEDLLKSTELEKSFLQKLQANDRDLRNRLDDTDDYEQFMTFQTKLVATLKGRTDYIEKVLEALEDPDVLKGLVLVGTRVENNVIVFESQKMPTMFVNVKGVIFEVNTISQDQSKFQGVGQGDYFYHSGKSKIYLSNNLVHYILDDTFQSTGEYEKHGIDDRFIRKILATSRIDLFPNYRLLTANDLVRATSYAT